MARPGGQTLTDPTVTAFTAGVASALGLAANVGRECLVVQNASATATIAIAPVNFGAAVLNGAGSITLGPLGTIIFDAIRITSGLNIIASAASTPVTFWEF